MTPGKSKTKVTLWGLCIGLSFLLLGVSVLLLAAVIRALLIEPADLRVENVHSAETYTFPQHVLDKAVKRFGDILQFRTISTAAGQYDRQELWKLRQYIEKNFASVFNASFVQYEVVNNYSLLFTVKGTDPSLQPFMLISHLDVVPTDEAEWHFDSFLGKVVTDPDTGEDVIWGRGAIDDKVGVAGILCALELLIEEGWVPHRTFYVGFGHDEEVSGSDGAGHIAKVLQQRGVMLQFLLDEGMPILSGLFPGVNNPVAPIAVTEKGRLDMVIEVEGESGHSSFPPANQAVARLSKAINNLYRYPQPSMFGYGPEADMLEALAPWAAWPYRLFYANTWLFGPLLSWVMSMKRESNSLIRTTTAVTIVRGGIKDNVIPNKAWAHINHRIHPAQTLEDVVAYDRAAINDPEVKVSVEYKQGPHPVSPYGPESYPYKLIASSLQQAYPDVIPIPGIMIANTDTVSYLNLSTHIYRIIPAQLDAVLLASIHGRNERMPVHCFHKAVKFYYNVLKCASKKEEVLFSQHGHSAGEL